VPVIGPRQGGGAGCVALQRVTGLTMLIEANITVTLAWWGSRCSVNLSSPEARLHR